MAEEMKKIVKAHCNRCLGDTNHELLRKEKTSWCQDDPAKPGYDLSGSDTYEMLKCIGCDTVALRHTSWFSEDHDSTVRYYPPAVSRQEPEWLTDLYNLLPSKFMHDLLEEVYVALHNDSRRLATMGVRALLDHVMTDKVGDNGSFKANISEFEKQGYIAARQRKMLEVVLEAGHAVMHRSYQPSKEDLEAALSITENLIQSIYIHQAKSKRIKVPRRRRQK